MGRKTNNNEIVIIKEYNNTFLFQKERDVLNRLKNININNENIPRLEESIPNKKINIFSYYEKLNYEFNLNSNEFIQILNVLEHAHLNGINYGIMKPDNVL